AAYGHIGHLTNLTQFGVLGFALFSIYLPVTVLRSALYLALYPNDDIKLIGIIAGVTMIYFVIMFFMSGNFFTINNNTNAIIFGAGIRLAWTLRNERKLAPPLATAAKS